MGRTTARSLARLLIISVVASATIIALTGPSWAAGGTQAAAELAFSQRINSSRDRSGLGPLTVNLALTRVARAWSDRMAADGKISHNPQIATQVAGDWTRLGENVGFSSRSGTTTAEFVDRLHVAFMESPGHRANIMGDYNQVGIGVVMAGDTMWVTVNFMKADTVVSNRTVYEAGAVASRVFATAGRAGRRAEYAVVTASNQASYAMGAAVLAGRSGPILYTHPANRWDPSPVLHPRTRTEIDRVLGGRGLVYVVGGLSNVSASAVRELVNDGYTVRRLNGSSTAETLVEVAHETVRRHGNTGRVVIGQAGDWGNTVAAAVWAANSRTPFLVTGRYSVPPSVKSFLSYRAPSRRWVIGPRTSVSVPVQRALKASRIAGENRVVVSVNVAKRLWNRTTASDGDRWAPTPGYQRFGWAYTMAHAPWSAAFGGPALLMGDGFVPPTVSAYLSQLDYGYRAQGTVRAASPVPLSVVRRVETLVAAR